MRKPFPFNTLSNQVFCSHHGCKKAIKMNLVTRRPTQNSFKCFKHYMQDIWAERNRKEKK